MGRTKFLYKSVGYRKNEVIVIPKVSYLMRRF